MSGRTVELALEDAERIDELFSVCVLDDATKVAARHLSEVVAQAKRHAVMDRLRTGEAVPVDEVLGMSDEDLEHVVTGEAHRPRPQWANVAKATRIIGATVAADPGYQSRADDLGAYVRDTWDALGLSLYDDETLYVALTTAGLMVEMANNGHTREPELVTPAIVEGVAQIAQSFTAAVMPYLPREARP